MAFRHWMALFCLLLGGCGRTSIVDNVDAGSTFRPEPTDESCNRLDDDLDGRVDEDFVDEGGRYVNDAHCGRCDAVCSPPDENTLTAGCRSVDDVPTCAALECVEGFTPSNNGRCIAAFDELSPAYQASTTSTRAPRSSRSSRTSPPFSRAPV